MKTFKPLSEQSLNLIKNLIVEAGSLVEQGFIHNTNSTSKTDGSPLTLTDTAVDSFLKQGLLKIFPEAGWLSEETSDNETRLNKEWIWIVDPLDGTKEFIRKIPELAISIGLVHANKVVLGAVYNPISKEGCCSNSTGKKLFWGIEALTKDHKELKDALILVSRSEFERDEIKPFEMILRNLKPTGSIAYKLLKLAAGHGDLVFTVKPKSEWDICGGIGLLESMGAVYLRFDRKPCLFNQTDPRISCGAIAGTTKFAQMLFEHLKNRNLI